MWACADDTKPPQAVEKCLDALITNDDAVMAHGPILFRIPGRADLITVINPLDMSSLGTAERIQIFIRNVKHLCIQYGLYRREFLKRAVFSNCYGQEYLLCLQMLVLGRFAAVSAPMLVYTVRKQLNADPVYDELPPTLINLLTAGPVPRAKCWTVWLLGCFYVLKIKGVSVRTRIIAAHAHFLTLFRLYRKRLALELLFLLFFPLACLACWSWQLAKKCPVTARFARKLKTVVATP
jgi:hypothetical protein